MMNMREIITLVEARLPKNIDLFQLTEMGRLPSIRQHGLDPNYSREPSFRDRHIYLAADYEHAAGYENHHGDWKSVPVMLKIMSATLDHALLGPDDCDLPDIVGDNWRVKTWAQSLHLSGQCTYSGVIPPSSISFSKDGKTWEAIEAYQSSKSGDFSGL